jgi:hypothetical protein
MTRGVSIVWDSPVISEELFQIIEEQDVLGETKSKYSHENNRNRAR